MSTLTAAKHTAYARLSASSSAWTAIDLWLAEHAPEIWQKTRQVDDWLHQYREDDRVDVPQYERVCGQLRALYEQLPDGYGVEDDAPPPPSVYRLEKRIAEERSCD